MVGFFTTRLLEALSSISEALRLRETDNSQAANFDSLLCRHRPLACPEPYIPRGGSRESEVG